MTQLVTVQTDFRDLEQMAQGLVGRVHPTHVILPAGDAVDEGEWAQFEIALHDGSAGLAGVGRCVTVVDNGDERAAHQRFDVVFDSLQFDDHEQRVFEHILSMHGAGGEVIEEVVDAESLPPQQIDDDAGGYVEIHTEFSGSLQVEGPSPHSAASESYADDLFVDASSIPSEEHDAEDVGDNTMIASVDELEAAISDPEGLRPQPGGEANDAVPHAPASAARSGGGSGGAAGYGTGRMSVAHALQTAPLEDVLEEPLSGERIAPQPRPLNGAVFAYSNGIPFPAKPPRPELDASLRVTPAPRPAGGGGH